MAQRTVAVTGAGSGNGAAIAHAFAGRGDIVHVGDVSQVRLDETVDSISTRCTATWWTCAVRGHRALRQHAKEATGSLDVFVNNAGVFDGYAGVDETSPELWQSVIDVNLTGYFYGAKAAVDAMEGQGRDGSSTSARWRVSGQRTACRTRPRSGGSKA